MKTEDIIINVILTLLVGISAAIIKERFDLDFYFVILVSFIIITIFWFVSSIKEIDNRSQNNLLKINQNKLEIEDIKKELNINNRITKLELWKEKMNNKKAKIDILDLIRIAGILIILFILLKSLGIF